MTCPHCSYIHGWDAANAVSVEGQNGPFYESPVKVERENSYRVDQKTLYACPSCGLAFIDV